MRRGSPAAVAGRLGCGEKHDNAQKTGGNARFHYCHVEIICHNG
jgi:hypothetical protein